MILTLAMRNLFHDRISLVVTLVGILFSVVLVAVQLGIYAGTSKIITAVAEHARGDIWISAFGTKSIEESGLLTGNERYIALATPGVQKVFPIVASFNTWKRPDGATQLCVVIGAEVADDALVPWNIVAGGLEQLRLPDAIAIDDTYYENLGVSGVGSTAEINDQRVRVTTVTHGIRSFTTTPYVFTTLSRARALQNMPPESASFYLVRVEPGANVSAVKAELEGRLPDHDILTSQEMKDRSIDHWLFGTGAGIALIVGAVLGTLVGTVIVAQTLYASTKDHLNEFATLRALGSSSFYIHRVILTQAGLSAIIGYALGMSIALYIVYISTNSRLPIIMTPELALGLFALTVSMCAISAISAIIKVTRIDPAMVFSR
ncbi:MAG: ABC transporter permease [Hyphomicrobiaceae bacterium]